MTSFPRPRHLMVLFAVLAAAPAPARADVTIVTTMTIEGGAAMLLGVQESPRMVQRIKGSQVRTDIEQGGAAASTTLMDLAARRVQLIDHAQRTVTVLDGTQPAPVDVAAIPPMKMSMTPTGRTRTVQGVSCTEQQVSVSTSMAGMTGGTQLPPEAATMLQGITIRNEGTICFATTGPGAAEFAAHQKALAEAGIGEALGSGLSGIVAGLDRAVRTSAGTAGIPYVTEMTTTIEGTGPMVDMLRQMGLPTVRMEVTSVSTDAIPDGMFEIPEGYAVVR